MDVATLSLKIDSTDVKSANSAMSAMTQTGGKLEGVVKGIAAAWASWKVVQYAREAATLAARYETLGAVMGVVGNNAGYTAAQMATFELGLTKTGISMIGARDALTMMAGAQMDLTKSSQMARIAQDAAVIGNINSSEAFQRMVQGIRSGETEILRTIGISVNFEQAYAKVSRQLGKTAKDLTDTEKLIARQNVVMEYGSKIAGAYEASMGTAGKQLLSMQRYAEDLQVVFGAIFSDAFGVVVQSLNTALSDTKKWLDKNGEAAETMRVNLGSAAKNFVGLVKDVMGIASDMTKFNDELSIGEILTGGLALAMAVVRDAVMAIVGVIQTLWGAIATIISGVIYGFTKLVGMIGGFQPPAWMKTFYQSSKGIFNDGGKNLQGGAISEFYSGTPFDPKAFEADHAAKMAAAKAESAKILAGNKSRQEADALAKRTQATEAAIKAEKKFAEVMRESDRATQAAIELREYNRVMDEATEAIRKRDQAIQDAARITDQFLTPKQAFEKDKAYYNTLNLDIETYKRAIKSIDPVWTDTFGSMARTLDDFSMRGTDAFVEFCFTGKAQFSDLITSMLRDLARLTVQKNVMGPLFDLLGVGINYLANGGAGNNNLGSQGLPSTFLGTGTGGGYSFTQSAAPAVSPMSAPIIVNVSSDGRSSVEGGNGTPNMKALGLIIGAKVREELIEQSRQGGLMARA